MSSNIPTHVQEAISRSDDVLESATTEHNFSKVFAAVSGGNDSGAALSVAFQSDHIELDGIVFVDTGINVLETKQFVKEEAERRNLEFHCVDDEYVSDSAKYENLVKVHGFPGPPIHSTMFNNLKGKRLYNFFKEQSEEGTDIGVISGVLADESSRRMENIGNDPIEEKQRSIWISPLYDWKTETVDDYRDALDLRENDVTALLHVSGDCNCGAYGHRKELRELISFYPEAAEKIKKLEWEVVKRVEQGKIKPEYSLWAHGRTADQEMAAKQDSKQTGFNMCSGCEDRVKTEYSMVGRTETPAEAYLRSDSQNICGPMSVYCVDCDIIVEDGRKHRKEVHPDAGAGPDNLDIRAIPQRCSDIGGLRTTEGEISTEHPDGKFCNTPHEQHDWTEYNGPNDVALRKCEKCGAFEVPVSPDGKVTNEAWPRAAEQTPHNKDELLKMHEPAEKDPDEIREDDNTAITEFI